MAQLESLERRILTSASLDGGVLRIAGTDGADLVEIATYGSGVVELLVNQARSRWTDVRELEVNLGAGDDTLRWTGPAGDWSGDGKVDMADLTILASRWGKGAGLADLAMLATNWGRQASNRIPATIVGGDGDDILHGGRGDDLIVAIDAGADTIRAGGGWDVVWCDGLDTADVVTHRVTGWWSDTVDPASPYAYADYGDRPLFDAVEVTDIRQGQVGDCWLLAALAATAHAEPDAIRQTIAPLGDGTSAVAFWDSGRYRFLRVDADLPTRSSRPAYADARSGTWVALIEKAYASFRRQSHDYAALNAGWMGEAFRRLSGQGSQDYWLGSYSAAGVVAYYADALAAGRPVTVATGSTAAGRLAANHAYAVVAATANQITLYNPWGTYVALSPTELLAAASYGTIGAA